ncbi:glycosyltransferase family 2 protein [Gramella lutea]|uniref:Glycosyltransferase family 2 protein n=1 Tax=Christiangramia lutea TaxID=1607951 RepID=A0A9X1V026_9FLAO|nr:glycosyltransferase family 2 protein [Christiangramia lutea]MCH4821584.1 glycosyltransferase family 2 protein [Christiangramia lutea]
MSLAIVIPYYKIKYFRECLQSLENQTNKDFKVYIGNDGSPDDPGMLIKEFSRSLNIEYRYFKNNLGNSSLVAHWERCLKPLRSERWLMFLGDDDLLGPNCVEKFYENQNLIEKNKINVVRFSTVVINKSGEPISKRFLHPELEDSVDFLFRKLNGETRSSLSEYVFRISAVRRNQFKDFPLAWHTDDLALLEFSNAEKIYSINDAKVCFRNSGDNITSTSNLNTLKNKASFQFYYYLLNDKKEYFNHFQLNYLVRKLEACYNNDKKNYLFFIKFTKTMLRNGFLGEYINFFRLKLLKSFQN